MVDPFNVKFPRSLKVDEEISKLIVQHGVFKFALHAKTCEDCHELLLNKFRKGEFKLTQKMMRLFSADVKAEVAEAAILGQVERWQD